MLDKQERNAGMLDTIFTISTVVFFALCVLYVTFCDELR